MFLYGTYFLTMGTIGSIAADLREFNFIFKSKFGTQTDNIEKRKF